MDELEEKILQQVREQRERGEHPTLIHDRQLMQVPPMLFTPPGTSFEMRKRLQTEPGYVSRGDRFEVNGHAVSEQVFFAACEIASLQ